MPVFQSVSVVILTQMLRLRIRQTFYMMNVSLDTAITYAINLLMVAKWKQITQQLIHHPAQVAKLSQTFIMTMFFSYDFGHLCLPAGSLIAQIRHLVVQLLEW